MNKYKPSSLNILENEIIHHTKNDQYIESAGKRKKRKR